MRNKKIPKNTYKQKDKQRKENPDTLCSLKEKKKNPTFSFPSIRGKTKNDPRPRISLQYLIKRH